MCGYYGPELNILLYYSCVDIASLAALKRKKMLENELEKLQGTKFQLEMNVNTLESAKINQETMVAMKKASDALKEIHGNLCVLTLRLPTPYRVCYSLTRFVSSTLDKVDKTMADIQEQTQLAAEIQDQISSGPLGAELDEVRCFVAEIPASHLESSLVVSRMN